MKTGAHLKIRNLGTNVQGVRLFGDPKKPEHAAFVVSFPGGNVEISRHSDGSYWVHAYANSPQDELHSDGLDQVGRIIERRAVSYRPETQQLPYHLAVRIGKD